MCGFKKIIFFVHYDSLKNFIMINFGRVHLPYTLHITNTYARILIACHAFSFEEISDKLHLRCGYVNGYIHTSFTTVSLSCLVKIVIY